MGQCMYFTLVAMLKRLSAFGTLRVNQAYIKKKVLSCLGEKVGENNNKPVHSLTLHVENQTESNRCPRSNIYI